MGASSQSTLHLIRKISHAFAHNGRGVMVQRIIWVGLNEQEDETKNDSIDAEHGFPIVTQNVKAHVAVHVDIRMINLGLAFTFRRIVRVVG